MEGAKAFVKYAVTNSKNKNLIVCPCKKCGLDKSLRPEEVYDHLTGGRGIMPNYTEWIWHGEKIRAHVLIEYLLLNLPSRLRLQIMYQYRTSQERCSPCYKMFLACIIFGQMMVSVKWKCKPNMYLRQLWKKSMRMPGNSTTWFRMQTSHFMIKHNITNCQLLFIYTT